MSPPVDPTGVNECRFPEPEEFYFEDECRLPEAAPICSEPESEGDWSKVGDLLTSLWAPFRNLFVSAFPGASGMRNACEPEDRELPSTEPPLRVGNDRSVSSSHDIRELIGEARSRGRRAISQLQAGPTVEFPQASAAKRLRAFQNSPAILPLGINYYLSRALDFAYRNPEGLLPDYYLDYGDKYAKRFAHETAPQLSAEGRRWAQNTLPNLQRAMNNTIMAGAVEFARLERDDEAFIDYAYGTHVSAYEASGIYHVADRGTLSDLIAIAGTPDPGDLLNWNGISLMTQLAPGIMGAMVFGE